MRQELGLPRTICEYEDVFSNELPGLPSHKDVDFTIELRLLSCKNLKSNYMNYWTGVLLDRALHLGALRCCFPRRRTRPFGYS